MPFPFILVDLTHTLSEDVPSWNASCGFQNTIKLDYEQNGQNVGFRVQQIKMHAGIGTHIDVPAHCVKNGQTVDEIDINNLLARCYILDVSDKAHETYKLSIDEIMSFQEEKNIHLENSFLLIKTGWGKFWNFPDQYRNNNIFPSISKEAAQYLNAQNIFGVGIDTLSPDCINSGFPVHEILLKNNKYIIENVYFNDKMPSCGAYVMIAPMKIKNGTESPVRLIGIVSKD